MPLALTVGQKAQGCARLYSGGLVIQESCDSPSTPGGLAMLDDAVRSRAWVIGIE